MIETPVKKRGRGFVKGEIANPDGKKPGTLNKNTKNFLKIKSLAADRYEEAFEILWEAVEAKESWAHKIFFSDLVPKSTYQPTIKVNPDNDTVEGQINDLTKGLAQFGEFTQEETLSTLKTLNSIKTNEVLVAQTNTLREDRDSILKKVMALEKVIDHIDNEKE
jgi:hypothetical protein